jgi:hypothetical protein
MGLYISQADLMASGFSSGQAAWKHWAQGTCLDGSTTPVLTDSSWTSVTVSTCGPCIQWVPSGQGFSNNPSCESGPALTIQ